MRDEMRIHWTSLVSEMMLGGKVFITGKLGDPRWQHKGGGLKILACCNGSSLLTRHTKADWHLYMTPESRILSPDFYSFRHSWPHRTTWKESQQSTTLEYLITVLKAKSKGVIPFTCWAFKLILKVLNWFNNIKLSFFASHMKSSFFIMYG